MKSIIVIILFLSTTSLFAATKVAVVKIMRGEVDVLTLGKTTKLKVDDWVESGAVIKTGEKSFARLVFVDKSTMNISANSEMKIESFSGKDSGVIDLVKGRIKSQVTKDYLQIKQDKSKLFIKTQNAVMGVRGTEFDVITNGKNTITVLHEGEIVFNRLEDRGHVSSERLEQIVDAGVRLQPKDFSVMDSTRTMPTVPARLNPEQLDALQKSEGTSTDERKPSNASPDHVTKSVVPEGLSGSTVSNNTATLKAEVGNMSGAPDAAAAAPAAQSASSADPEGYVKGNLIKPANGSFVHLESGTIIPPPSNAVLDSNTNTYIASGDTGSVSSDGSFIPPKNVEITSDGKVMVAVTDSTGKVVVKEVPPPPVVLTVHAPNPLDTKVLAESGPTGPAPKVLNPEPPPYRPPVGQPTSGGIIGVNDPTRQSALIDTTIIVTPKP
jgi:hypothetical protein